MKKQNICRLFAAILSVLLGIALLAPAASAAIMTQEKPVINTFIPGGKESGGLLIHKEVEHPYGDAYTIPSGLTFDFKIELGSYYAGASVTTTAGKIKADKDGVIVASIKAGETLGLQKLKAGATVTVTELLKEGSGFAAKGEATQKALIPEAGDAALTFINVYTPAAVQPSGVVLRGEKKLTGRDWQADDSFTILLERQTAEGWEQVATRNVTKGNTAFDFSDDLQKERFDAPGSYNYRITEQKGAAANITYDATVNPLSIKVTDRDMDGALEIADVTAGMNGKVEKGEKAGAYTVTVTFENVYAKPSDPADPDQPGQPGQPDQPGQPSDPDQPAGPSAPQQPGEGSPDTGDHFEPWHWLLLLLISGAALAWLLYCRRFWKTKE